MDHQKIIAVYFVLAGFWILALSVFVSDIKKFWNFFGPRKNYIINSGIVVGLVFCVVIPLIPVSQKDADLFWMPQSVAALIVGVSAIFMTWAALNRVDGMIENNQKMKLEKMREATRARLISEAEMKEKSRNNNKV